MSASPGTDAPPDADEVRYFLPKSVLELEGELVRRTGSRCELGKTVPMDSFELTDVKLKVRTIPDTTRAFDYKLPRLKNGVSLTGVWGLSSDGILESSNQASEEQVTTSVLTGVQAVASVASAVAAAALSERTGTCEVLEQDRRRRLDELEKETKETSPREEYLKFLREEIKKAEKGLKTPTVKVLKGAVRCEFEPTVDSLSFSFSNKEPNGCVFPDKLFPDGHEFTVTLGASKTGASRDDQEDGDREQEQEQEKEKKKKTDPRRADKEDRGQEPEEKAASFEGAEKRLCKDEDAAIYYYGPAYSTVKVLHTTNELERLVARSGPVPFPQFADLRHLPCGRYFGRSKVSVKVELHRATGSIKKLDVALGSDPSVKAKQGAEILKTIGDTTAKEIGEAAKAKASALEDDVKTKLLETCKAALDAGNWSEACEQ